MQVRGFARSSNETVPNVRKEIYQTTGTETVLLQLMYFLLYHAVFKRTTTKLGVVFDGSAKTTSGLSINDTQMVGSAVPDDLFSIIVRLRKHRYVLSRDIEKMYRQVRVDREDRRFQRILWRPNPLELIQVFELNMVTYGTASTLFLAIRVLRHLGNLFSKKFLTAS
ncbi:uncharacterized protein LOC143186478 [Calliopsis andreniformis]|uniref:uncharacterized protein LOC143186478 n=1 Tax=Calliopsis andreniformis TaxID=337506 RepID=UPI003FCDFBE4